MDLNRNLPDFKLLIVKAIKYQVKENQKFGILELQNRVTQNNVTLSSYSKFFTKILLSSY